MEEVIMLKENLNKILDIIEKDKKFNRSTKKLARFFLTLAEDKMVGSDFTERFFHIIEEKANSAYISADTYRLDIIYDEGYYYYYLFRMHAKGIGTKKALKPHLIASSKWQSIGRLPSQEK